jgi:hypothetical protein
MKSDLKIQIYQDDFPQSYHILTGIIESKYIKSENLILLKENINKNYIGELTYNHEKVKYNFLNINEEFDYLLCSESPYIAFRKLHNEFNCYTDFYIDLLQKWDTVGEFGYSIPKSWINYKI